MKFAELKKSLAAEVLPFYIVTGDDGFLIDKAVEIFESLAELRELNCSRFEGSIDVSSIVASAVSLPIMSKYRVVFIIEPTFDMKPIADYLRSPSSNTVLVAVSQQLTKNFSTVTSLATLVDCSRTDERFILSYIARECAAENTKITAQAADTLIDFCNRYMSRISIELKKLIAYKVGGLIERADVEKLVSPGIEYKIFELSDSIAQGKKSRAMQLLEDLLGTGNSAVSLFGLIYAHFRKLLYVSICDEQTVKSKLAVKDYPYRLALAQAKNFTPVRLKSICDSMHKLDLDYKTGKMSDRLGLETLVMLALNNN